MISPRWTVVYQIHAKMVGHVVYEQIGGFAGLEKTDGIGAGEGVRAVDRVHRRQAPTEMCAKDRRFVRRL